MVAQKDGVSDCKNNVDEFAEKGNKSLIEEARWLLKTAVQVGGLA